MQKFFSTIKNIIPSSKAYNPLSITFTYHPTNIEFNFKDNNGNVRRPYLWEEITEYAKIKPALMANIIKNPYIKNVTNFNTWGGFDMDRHQDEQTGIFTYAYLRQIQGIINGYKEIQHIDDRGITDDIENLCQKMEENFNKNKEINLAEITEELQKISSTMKELIINTENQIPLFPLNGINGHYRISSEDLTTEVGVKKIRERLQEITTIQKIFGKAPVSEIIIADCTTKEHILQVENLLKEAKLSKLHVVPLIEEELSDDVLKEIISHTKTKIMLAGSDSIQRETWVGATLMKCKIQELLHNENKIREKNNEKPIIFFEGTGSTVNRNGCMPRSRMGTILENMPYERTIQGRQYQSFISDISYQTQTIKDLSEAQRCTIDDIKNAEKILQNLYNEVSSQQKNIQKEPHFTNFFDKEKIFNLVQEHSHYGSRAKAPKDLEKFTIKSQRAITQSFINNTTSFHPEMLYWGSLSEKTKNLIKENIHNPIIQDFLNQYTAVHQACNPEKAEKWFSKQLINSRFFDDEPNQYDNKLQNEFNKGYTSFGNFIKEIQEMKLPEDVKSKLILNNYEDQRPRFNHENTTKEEFNKHYSNFSTTKEPLCTSLNKKIGCGFGTTNKTKSSFVL